MFCFASSLQRGVLELTSTFNPVGFGTHPRVNTTPWSPHLTNPGTAGAILTTFRHFDNERVCGDVLCVGVFWLEIYTLVGGNASGGDDGRAGFCSAKRGARLSVPLTARLLSKEALDRVCPGNAIFDVCLRVRRVFLFVFPLDCGSKFGMF